MSRASCLFVKFWQQPFRVCIMMFPVLTLYDQGLWCSLGIHNLRGWRNFSKTSIRHYTDREEDMDVL